ncbi:unnamed protein product [Pleuronectes platessa]|uniref:Uncharacterized protein n=1 Tax=Pleuronectes platessa TaxID=8262 RepID=A0A9N7YXQ2_PLEPL|nr:unnamed protein product [Pleuronectes platessa]
MQIKHGQELLAIMIDGGKADHKATNPSSNCNSCSAAHCTCRKPTRQSRIQIHRVHNYGGATAGSARRPVAFFVGLRETGHVDHILHKIRSLIQREDQRRARPGEVPPYLLFDRRQEVGGGRGAGVRREAAVARPLSDRHGPFPLHVPLLHRLHLFPPATVRGRLAAEAPSLTLQKDYKRVCMPPALNALPSTSRFILSITFTASITCHTQQAACQSVKRAHRSLSRRPAAKDEVTPRLTGLESGTRTEASRAREKKRAARDSPARCCCQKQATAGSIRPVTHPSSDPRAAVTAATLPTRRINKNKQHKQPRARPRTPRAAAYIAPVCLFSSCACGGGGGEFNAPIYPWRPLGTRPHLSSPPSLPPVNQHAQPRLPFSSVTSPCGCGLNRSSADAPLHAVAAGRDAARLAAPRAQELLLERMQPAAAAGRACLRVRVIYTAKEPD